MSSMADEVQRDLIKAIDKDNLTITRILQRHLHTGQINIDHEVRRQLIVEQPVIEGAKQVGTTCSKLRHFHTLSPGLQAHFTFSFS